MNSIWHIVLRLIVQRWSIVLLAQPHQGLVQVPACGQKVVEVSSNQWLHLEEPGIVGEKEVHNSRIFQQLVDCLVAGKDVQVFGGYLPHPE